MLVAYALYAVASEAVLKQSGALESLAYCQLGVGILLLKQIARAHGTG